MRSRQGTGVTVLNDLLDEGGDLADMPTPALNLALHLASIIRYGVRLIIIRNSILAICCAAVLGGCQIGAHMLPVSNANYSDAVRVSQSEELLINLVRLRYRDLPVFLAVTDISTQFEFGSSGTVGGGTGGGSPDFVAGAGLSYSERPTTSFSILGARRSKGASLRRWNSMRSRSSCNRAGASIGYCA